MKIQKIFVVLFSICCFLFGALTTKAADERLGTVVDGSLLVEGMEVEGFTQTMARGTYLGAGSGKLTNKGNHIVNVFGNTTCNKICDEVKVTLHLQRLEGNSWATIYTLGPKVAKNTNYVSNSKNYTIGVLPVKRTMKNNNFFSVSLLTGWRYFYAAFNVSS